jgi:upstream activation factor subunit UAF30
MTSRKPKTKSVPEVVAPVPEVVAPEVEVASEVEAKVRKVVSRDTVLGDIDTLSNLIEDEISRVRDGVKAKGVKFLRSIGKQLKSLHKDTSKILKKKKTAVHKNNTNSGFLKPVKISSELSKFTGWDSSELKSRVDVTKFICNYIKEKNLQDPKDRRQIVADPKLAKLLKFDAKTEEKPLTYYRIQTYIKPHFIK